VHRPRRVKGWLDVPGADGYSKIMKPLSGLRILEFDGLGPVTFAGMILADLGAEVLRLTRSASAGSAVFAEVGGEVLHRGRAAVEVNLKNPEDHARILDLIAGADAVIEGFRPGVMERLGLGPDVCAARNPRLVFGRVTGWGQTGRMADQVGHDINYIALSGALHAMGEPDRPPRAPLNLVGDYGGGAMMLVTGVLAGLLEAKRTGRGRVVDAAMTDGSALLMSLFSALSSRGLWNETRGSNLLDGGAPFYRCYACRDGGHVAVGALEPRFYAALITGLGLSPEDAPQFDMANWPALHQRFESLFAKRDRDDWAGHFAGTEACVTPVLSLTEAARHPHNVARGTFAGEPLQPAPAPRFAADGLEVTPQREPLSLDEAIRAWAGFQAASTTSSDRT
jgi:alpha-methylacyl-CoA racemase